MKQQIKNIFSDNLVTIKEDESLSAADDLMTNCNIRHLPVVNKNNKLIGMLSKADYAALRYSDSKFANHKVKVFMSSPVKVVSPTATVRSVARIFMEKKISSVIVSDDTGMVGILTSEDLIRLLAEENEFLKDMEQLDLASLADEGWISMTTMTQ